MTMRNAVAALAVAVDELWSAVTELAVIALDDQPGTGGSAAADDFGERVSELQGDIAAARAAARAAAHRPPEAMLGFLSPVARHLHDAEHRHWRQLRSHESMSQLVAGARRAGGQWPAWQQSVVASAKRCDEPLARSSGAMQLCWEEIEALLLPVQESNEAIGARSQPL